MKIREGDCQGVCNLLASGQGHISDIIYPYGVSVIQLAIQYGRKELCDLLIALGAELEPLLTWWTPHDVWTYFADCSLSTCTISASEVLQDLASFQAPGTKANKLLLSNATAGLGLNSFSRYHRSVLGLTCESLEDLNKAVKDEVNDTDSSGRTPLYWAVKQGSFRITQQLLHIGAETEICDVNGCTPLHIAAALGWEEGIRLLTANGANLQAKDRTGASPLHYACIGGHLQAAHQLLALGADIEAKNAFDETPLESANHGRHGKIVALLVQHGALVDHVDSWGYTPLLDAVISDAHDTLGTYLCSTKGGCDARLFDGQSILHIAARNSDRKTMEILLQADLPGVDIQWLDSAGKTAMEYLLQRRDAAELAEVFGTLLMKVEVTNKQRDPLGGEADV